MAGARRLGILCALLALLLTSAASASGKPKRDVEVQPAMGSAFVGFPESGGYDIGISAPNDHVLLVYAEKVDESGSAQIVVDTVYAVHAHNRLAKGVIRASVGDLGQVSLRFKPGRRPELGHNSRTCEGRAPESEFGTFRGTVSLEGEGGYFHTKVSSAAAEFHRSFRLRCARGHAEDATVAPLRHYVEPKFGFGFGGGGGSIALLYAVAKAPERSVGIRVAHYAGAGPGAEVSIGAFEERAGMAIGRHAYVDGEVPGMFLTSAPGTHPATAKFAPPPPFHGEAEYLENSATSHSWVGSLGVPFPGLDLPLAGPEFASSLCVLSPLKSPSGCDFAKPQPLRYTRPNPLAKGP